MALCENKRQKAASQLYHNFFYKCMIHSTVKTKVSLKVPITVRLHLTPICACPLLAQLLLFEYFSQCSQNVTTFCTC